MTEGERRNFLLGIGAKGFLRGKAKGGLVKIKKLRPVRYTVIVTVFDK